MPIARTGAVLVLAGSLALAAYAWQTWRTRARWSGDAGWHRFAMGGLVSAIAWFELGMTMACGRLLAAGVDPAESTATILIGPLVLGWVGLTVLASATHLVPAIGPGDPAAHARQRVMLGRWATVRLVAADAGIALSAVGLLPVGGDLASSLGVPLAGAGLALAGLALGGQRGPHRGRAGDRSPQREGDRAPPRLTGGRPNPRVQGEQAVQRVRSEAMIRERYVSKMTARTTTRPVMMTRMLSSTPRRMSPVLRT